MTWWKRTPEIDPAGETQMERLFSPLKSAAPASPGARQALQAALDDAGGRAVPAPRGVRGWQRALVGAGAVFVPLFAVGSVAGLGGAPMSGPLDAVAGVFKSGSGSPGGGPFVLDQAATPTPQAPADGAAAGSSSSATTRAEVCAEATANASEILQALLDAAALPESGAAGVTAALQAIEDCGTGSGAGAICLEATATARDVLQALLDTETLPQEGRTGIAQAIAAIDACGSSDDEAEDTAETTGEETPAAEGLGGGPGTGHETCFEATAHAREVLQSLLDDEDRPEQSKKGLERALQALENCGTGNGKESGEPAAAESTPAPEPTPGTDAAPTRGKPDTAGKPDDAGKPETPGQQGVGGKPDTAGKPDATGKPDTAGAGKPDDPSGSTAGSNQAGGDAPNGPPDHAGGPSGVTPGQGQGTGQGDSNGRPGGNGGGPSHRPERP